MNRFQSEIQEKHFLSFLKAFNEANKTFLAGSNWHQRTNYFERLIDSRELDKDCRGFSLII